MNIQPLNEKVEIIVMEEWWPFENNPANTNSADLNVQTELWEWKQAKIIYQSSFPEKDDYSTVWTMLPHSGPNQDTIAATGIKLPDSSNCSKVDLMSTYAT